MCVCERERKVDENDATKGREQMDTVLLHTLSLLPAQPASIAKPKSLYEKLIYRSALDDTWPAVLFSILTQYCTLASPG